MKAKIFTLLAAFLVAALLFTSCEKTEQFDYPLETLYGTWKTTAMYDDDNREWLDITSYFYEDIWAFVTFNSDGTFYGSGYFGTGKGTYNAIGSIVQTYLEDQEYMRYEVISLKGDQAEFNMSLGKSSIRVRAQKQ